VSPLWRDEIGVYLSARRTCMVRLARGLRPSLARTEDVALPGNVAGWDQALAVFEQQLNAGGWSDALLRVVAADPWMRYTIVPWSDALSSESERLAHARELLANVYGESMLDWAVSLSDAPPGSSRLACATPSALINALRDMCARHKLKLGSVQPQLIAAYNTWRHLLPTASAAWFVTVEAGSLAALRMSGGSFDRVHAVRIGLDWARELKRLQTFGRLASSSASDGRVYVDLPEALRLLHPGMVGDLEWLDEASPPLTTLHQLELLRRKAA
jgi:hypothetical protein